MENSTHLDAASNRIRLVGWTLRLCCVSIVHYSTADRAVACLCSLCRSFFGSLTFSNASFPGGCGQRHTCAQRSRIQARRTQARRLTVMATVSAARPPSPLAPTTAACVSGVFLEWITTVHGTRACLGQGRQLCRPEQYQVLCAVPFVGSPQWPLCCSCFPPRHHCFPRSYLKYRARSAPASLLASVHTLLSTMFSLVFATTATLC